MCSPGALQGTSRAGGDFLPTLWHPGLVSKQYILSFLASWEVPLLSSAPVLLLSQHAVVNHMNVRRKTASRLRPVQDPHPVLGSHIHGSSAFRLFICCPLPTPVRIRKTTSQRYQTYLTKHNSSSAAPRLCRVHFKRAENKSIFLRAFVCTSTFRRNTVNPVSDQN